MEFCYLSTLEFKSNWNPNNHDNLSRRAYLWAPPNSTLHHFEKQEDRLELFEFTGTATHSKELRNLHIIICLPRARSSWWLQYINQFCHWLLLPMRELTTWILNNSVLEVTWENGPKSDNTIIWWCQPIWGVYLVDIILIWYFIDLRSHPVVRSFFFFFWRQTALEIVTVIYRYINNKSYIGRENSTTTEHKL